MAVEIAATASTRDRGLMYRDELAPNAGMLFVFPNAEPRSFWMRNTKIPLDILYLDEQGRILCVHARTTPFSQAQLRCEEPVRFVLEVVGGFAEQHTVHPGDRVELGELARTPVR